MSKKVRYTATDPLYDEENDILINLLHTVDHDILEEAEVKALLNAYKTLSTHYSDQHCFTAHDIQYLHKVFLGDIFSWAGQYRIVDISSSDLRYCHVQYIPKQMQLFENNILRKLTPFSANMSVNEMADRLATIHGELIIIHPFRDGNGRTTRLLCDLLTMQAGHRLTNWKKLYEKKYRPDYFRAVQHLWHTGDNAKLKELTLLLL